MKSSHVFLRMKCGGESLGVSTVEEMCGLRKDKGFVEVEGYSWNFGCKKASSAHPGSNFWTKDPAQYNFQVNTQPILA